MGVRPAIGSCFGFPVDQGRLRVGGSLLADWADTLGGTPFYAYDCARIEDRLTGLRQVLPAEIAIHYAVKANPFPPLLAFLADRLPGMDVASLGELRLARAAGVPGAELTFAGPGKRPAELAAAVAEGALIHLESFREAELLADMGRHGGKAARVAVRVNPDFELKRAGMKMGGGARPFGVDAEQVPALLRRLAQDGLDCQGFQIFAGSQNLDGEAIAETLRKSYELVLRLSGGLPGPVRRVNLGGGFGIPYFPGEQPLDLAPIGAALAGIAARAAAELPEARINLELGRYLVGEAGVYATRVIDRKVSRGRTFLVVDGGLHHHLAASGNFGQVLRRNFPVAVADRIGTAGEEEEVTVVGPLCTPLDVLADRVRLPPAGPGDLLVVFQSGAYGPTASPGRFLGHPPALEALV